MQCSPSYKKVRRGGGEEGRGGGEEGRRGGGEEGRRGGEKVGGEARWEERITEINIK